MGPCGNEDTAAPLAPPPTNPSSSCPAADYLLAHGVLLHPPQVYMDVFYPIFEYMAWRQGIVAAAAAKSTSNASATASVTAAAITTIAKGDADSEAKRTAAGAGATTAEDLQRFALPKVAAAHLKGYALIHTIKEERVTCEDKSKAQDSGDAPRGERKTDKARDRKRARDDDAAKASDNTPTATETNAPGGESESHTIHHTDPVLQQLITTLSSAAITERYLGPFESDADYLCAVDVYHVLAQWGSSAAVLDLPAAHLTLATRAGLDVTATLLPTIAATVAVYSEQVTHRLRKMATVPRVLRLAERLELSRKEGDALVLLLVYHYGSLLAATTKEALTLNTIAYYARLSPQESMWFVSGQRLHVKQGLVMSDAQARNNFAESRYTMSQEAVTALTGNDLGEEELIKLERTALADVLTEERKTRERAEAKRQQQEQEQKQQHHHHHRSYSGVSQGEEGKESHDTDTASASDVDDGTDCSSDAPGCDGDGEDRAQADAVTALGEALGSVGGDPASLREGSTGGAIKALLQVNTGRKGDGSATMTIAATTASEHADDHSSRSASAAATVAATGTATDAKTTSATAPSSFTSTPASRMHEPYTSDFAYMEEAFKMLASRIRLRAAEGDMKDEDDNYVPRSRVEATMRELKGKLRVSMAVHASRLAATLALADKVSAAPAAASAVSPTPAKGGKSSTGAIANAVSAATEAEKKTPAPFIPRIEQLSRRLKLSEMEKQTMLLMVGSVVSHDILVAVNGRYVMRDGQQRYLTVGYILFVLCDSLQERVAARRIFHRCAPLISDGILSLGLDGGSNRSQFNTDLMDYVCDVDRKIVDYLMGSDTETAEMVPGSSLYYPTVPLENVVLPAQTTKLVLSTITHYSMFERCKLACGFGEGLGNTTGGLVMLFHGPSGTGKTMLANAVAHELKKRLLLVNVAQFKAEPRAPEMMRFIFREAKLNDAIVFFDECEALFERRETNPLVTCVLTEFEKNDGLIIMATNLAQVMDEAMNRRISLMVEFKLPSHPMREHIWRHHVPRGITLAPDVSIEKLALNYELSGGLIRNAVLAALSHAVARENTDQPTLAMVDLDEGARLQLRGFFLAAARPGGGTGGTGGSSSAAIAGLLTGSELYITPRRTLNELVMEAGARRRVAAIAQLAKSRSTLFAQWGFNEEACQDQGCIYLLSGPSGTGKSLAAEGIAYECGATIRLCNVSELLLLRELNVAAVFEEGRRLGAVIVFDQAQELFSASDRAAQLSRRIQYYAVRYPKPVLVIATTGSGGAAAGIHGGGHGVDTIDIRAARFVFADHVVFRFPDRALRCQLWRSAFPQKAPLATDVDFDKLSEQKVSAKLLQRVAFTVCCQAAASGSLAAMAATAAPSTTIATATTTTTTTTTTLTATANGRELDSGVLPSGICSGGGGGAAVGTVTMRMIEDELLRCILAEEQRNPARGMFV